MLSCLLFVTVQVRLPLCRRERALPAFSCDIRDIRDIRERRDAEAADRLTFDVT